MAQILIIDPDGLLPEETTAALKAHGHETETVRCAFERAERPAPDAVVVAGQISLLGEVREAGVLEDVPVVLVTKLDRSGWDRTLGTEAALNVDALLDASVSASALVARLDGIIGARRATASLARVEEWGPILDRAVANEEAAASFYHTAARRVDNPATREILEDLARDEEEHRRSLLELRAGKAGLDALPTGASVAGIVETFGTPVLNSDLQPADAFLLAAHKEAMSVRLYEEWASLYCEGPQRELLKKLADVEREHKARVEDMFCNAAFPESWHD